MGAIRRKKVKKNDIHLISKLELINRLETLGKFEEALKTLKSNDLLYERWSAINEINLNDEDACHLIKRLGLDPDILLVI